MTPRLVFRPEAEAELLDARSCYETERVGLCAVFAAAVETTITGVLENPLAYSRVRGNTRRALVPSLSLRRVLRPTADEIVVLAVMHDRRNPWWWRSRR